MGKLLVWIMILGSVASSVAAQKRSDPFFFIQLSDPQLGFIDDNRSYARETELMELFTDAINRLRPAFVVVTGDMVHDLNDAGQVAEFDRLLDEYRAEQIRLAHLEQEQEGNSTPAKTAAAKERWRKQNRDRRKKLHY